MGFGIYETRKMMEGQFSRMKHGQWITFSRKIRSTAFPQADRISDLFLSMSGNRPETPSLVQEEMLISIYGLEVRSINPMSGDVTYEKTGRGPYQFSDEEISEIRRGETPSRLSQ